MAKTPKKSDLGKPWNRRPGSSPGYTSGRRAKISSHFMIFCEGKNTETFYFNAFHLKNASINVLGVGMSKVKLVKEVHTKISLMPNDKERKVWIVFDYDFNLDKEKNIQRDDFNQAVNLCKRYGYLPAYSNDAFELWFLLHYEKIESQLNREEYFRRLSRIWNIDYKREGKRAIFAKTIYTKLFGLQSEALKQAKKLYESCSNQQPSEQNPCTTVFQLVEELNHYI